MHHSGAFYFLKEELLRNYVCSKMEGTWETFAKNSAVFEFMPNKGLETNLHRIIDGSISIGRYSNDVLVSSDFHLNTIHCSILRGITIDTLSVQPLKRFDSCWGCK
mmetsp:Transcript_28304/g.42271  ORF Transcript_28304/g.42271 Transcript_28304/m.42271 type:complete len:106 (-) Transcript_28304:686-1003(-)